MFHHTGVPLILSAGQRQSQLDAEDLADIDSARMLPGVAGSADHGVSSFRVGAGAGNASIDGGRREFEGEVLGLLKGLKGDMMEMQTRMLRLEVQTRINQQRPEQTSPGLARLDPKSRIHASHPHSPRDSVDSGTAEQPASESDVDESVVSSATDLADNNVYSYVTTPATTPGTTPAATPVPTPIQTSRQPLSSQMLRQRNLERKRDEERKSNADYINRRGSSGGGNVGGGRRGAGKGGSGEFPRRRDSIGSVESVDTPRDTGIGRKASFSLNRQDTRELTKIAANAERRRSVSVEAIHAQAARTTEREDQPVPLGGASDLATMQSSNAVSASGQGTSGLSSLSSFVGVGSLVVGLGSLFKSGKSPSNAPPARKSAKHTFNAELEALCNIYKVRCIFAIGIGGAGGCV